MNILHMKYAVEVARLGSLSRAADALLIAQPNISRSIKELEADIGITIFHRSARGMTLTAEGEEFVRRATAILEQIEAVEALYQKGMPPKQKLSLSAPRTAYIADAFARFVGSLGTGALEVVYEEAGFARTLQRVLNGESKIGIIRYAAAHDAACKSMLEEKDIAYDLLAEFTPVLLLSASSPLAAAETVSPAALRALTEIADADVYVPLLPGLSPASDAERRLLVFSRAAQWDTLAQNPTTYMWSAPTDEATLSRYGLVARRPCADTASYKDLLIHKNNYKLTAEDKSFVTELCLARRRHIGMT